MTDSTRRGFLVQAGAAGVAVAGVAAAGSAVAVDAPAPAAPTAAGSTTLGNGLDGEPLVLFVKNPELGELALLVGTREIVYRDVAAVRTIMAKAKS